jgi:hypothetical protein
VAVAYFKVAMSQNLGGGTEDTCENSELEDTTSGPGIVSGRVRIEQIVSQ